MFDLAENRLRLPIHAIAANDLSPHLSRHPSNKHLIANHQAIRPRLRRRLRHLRMTNTLFSRHTLSPLLLLCFPPFLRVPLSPP